MNRTNTQIIYKLAEQDPIIHRHLAMKETSTVDWESCLVSMVENLVNAKNALFEDYVNCRCKQPNPRMVLKASLGCGTEKLPEGATH